jgi:hypothetical protein
LTCFVLKGTVNFVNFGMLPSLPYEIGWQFPTETWQVVIFIPNVSIKLYWIFVDNSLNDISLLN